MSQSQPKRETRQISPIVVMGLVLAIAAPLLLWFFTSRGGDMSPREVAPVSAPATTTAPSSAAPEQLIGGCNEATDIDTRVRCFLEVWYHLEPTDSTDTRRERISPYASDLFMNQEASSMEVMTDTAADQARIRQQITQSAQATGEILTVPDEEDPTLMQVIATVVLHQSSPDRPPTPHLTVHVNMVWQQVDGEWYAATIDDVGGE